MNHYWNREEFGDYARVRNVRHVATVLEGRIRERLQTLGRLDVTKGGFLCQVPKIRCTDVEALPVRVEPYDGRLAFKPAQVSLFQRAVSKVSLLVVKAKRGKVARKRAADIPASPAVRRVQRRRSAVALSWKELDQERQKAVSLKRPKR